MHAGAVAPNAIFPWFVEAFAALAWSGLVQFDVFHPVPSSFDLARALEFAVSSGVVDSDDVPCSFVHSAASSDKRVGRVFARLWSFGRLQLRAHLN